MGFSEGSEISSMARLLGVLIDPWPSMRWEYDGTRSDGSLKGILYRPFPAEPDKGTSNFFSVSR